jgi:hypothetical protein
VPIAVAIFTAIVPFYLLWQQNRLAYRQEQILRVQTNADTLNTTRQLTIDNNHADGARNNLAAIVTAFNYLRDAAVTVSFYKKSLLNEAPEPFSVSVPVKNFMPQSCTANVQPILPLTSFDVAVCENSNPIQSLKQQSGIVFNLDDLGRVALSLVYYLKLIADTQQTTLTGAGAGAVTLPQIIAQAIESCNLNSTKDLGGDPNRMQGVAITMASIERAAQELGNVYASEYFTPNFKKQDADQSKKDELL